MRIAVISDVHGNRWALEAVLDDAGRRRVSGLVDLGDSVYGPLDPGGCATILVRKQIPSVRGNEDRIIVQPPNDTDSATLAYTRSCLAPEQLGWLAALAPTAKVFSDLFCCHGTPQRDDEYLLEEISSGSVTLKPAVALVQHLATVDGSVVLCGHSHLPRVVRLPNGQMIINPGSVGLPAYSDHAPAPHAMEAGSPHARYAIVERVEDGWQVEHMAVPYDWEAAALAAAGNGRADWAKWLRTGRASAAP